MLDFKFKGLYRRAMDTGSFNLFIKLIKDEYRLSEAQILKVTRRLLADDHEFQRVWDKYKNKALNGGVDNFKPHLMELLT